MAVYTKSKVVTVHAIMAYRGAVPFSGVGRFLVAWAE